MDIQNQDFQDLYQKYAYSLYREVFEELNDVDAAREILYRIFSRLRDEGFEDASDLVERIHAYKFEYIKERKKAQFEVERVWYQMQSDEILGREMQPTTVQRKEPVRPIEPTEPVAPEEVAEVEEVSAPELPVQEEPQQATPLAEEMSVSEETMGELLADMERKGRRPRRIREVFPEEEEAAILAETEALQAAEEDDEEENDKPKNRIGVGILWFLLMVVILLFVWALLNLLMAQGILPFVDLGYVWFNENVMELFPIVAEITG